MYRSRILVVDDEPSMREFLDILLRREGYGVTLSEGGRGLLRSLESDVFDLVLCDMKMPDVSGLDVLGRVKDLSPSTIVIMMTGYASTQDAVEAMKKGAYDYITKPFKTDELRLIIRNAIEKGRLERENELLREELDRKADLPILVGKSPAMEQIRSLVERVADTRSNVLILGETGTGKELVAKAIHGKSSRRDQPFVTVNCGAIPETLIESELFGHVRGSFTGAVATKRGLFEVADGGTVFLDEVGELPLTMQVKLLRVIQDRTFKRIGGTEDITVDVRLLAATNKDLEQEVRQGRFREDLYYRLNVIQIHVPALRERREEIASLVDHFLKKYAREMNKPVRRISPAALQVLLSYLYPGNVRELENIIERAVTLEMGEEIGLPALPAEMWAYERKHVASGIDLPDSGLQLDEVLGELERKLLRQALDKTSGSRKAAADLLGVKLRSLRYRMEKHGLAGPGDPDDDA